MSRCYVSAADYARHFAGPLANPETRAATKARTRRQEVAVITRVRTETVDRDGYCRLYRFDPGCRAIIWEQFGKCHGPSEWAHFGAHRRSRTRGMSPAVRHTAAGSLMLCRKHHADYDQHRLVIEALGALECEGPLVFRTEDGSIYRESLRDGRL